MVVAAVVVVVVVVPLALVVVVGVVAADVVVLVVVVVVSDALGTASDSLTLSVKVLFSTVVPMIVELNELSFLLDITFIVMVVFELLLPFTS